MLTIGKLAELAQTTPDALRFYEREDLIAPTSKSEGGYRLYDADAEHGHALLRQREAIGGQVDRVKRHMRVGQLRGRRGPVLDGADALRSCGQTGITPRQLCLGGTEGQGCGLCGCGQAAE